jgi:hypothetical protein
VASARLQFHEGKACDAVVRYLERREGAARANLRFPERERHPASVELLCTIGGHLFALEHTGIEPFAGYMQLQRDAARIIGVHPKICALAALPDPD